MPLSRGCGGVSGGAADCILLYELLNSCDIDFRLTKMIAKKIKNFFADGIILSNIWRESLIRKRTISDACQKMRIWLLKT